MADNVQRITAAGCGEVGRGPEGAAPKVAVQIAMAVAQDTRGSTLESVDEFGDGDLGRVVDEQMNVVALAVELHQRGIKVGADSGEDFLHGGVVGFGESNLAVFGHEDQMRMKLENTLASTPQIVVHWFRPKMKSAKRQVLKAYRFRLEPTPQQRELCEVTAGHCRFVWNWMLDQRKNWYAAVCEIPAADRDASLKPTAVSQINQLPALKGQFPWLKDAPSHCLQQTLRDLDGAFQNFFSGRAGYPQFRRKDGGADRFRFPDPKHIRRENDFLHLPKLGAVRLRNSFRRIRGTLRSVTVSRRGKHWYASVLYRTEKPVTVHPRPDSAVGLDRNCGTNLCALSTGELVSGATPLKEALHKLARRQRALARKKKGSMNFRKAKASVNRCYERIANIRNDLLHKLTHRLSQSHATVVVESLRVTAMTASAGGTVEDPGSRVRQKSGLNRAILDRGWGELVRQLRYKLEWKGGELIEVNPAYTSQRCHACGHTAKENREGTRFVCVACGHRDHADVNAAKNILTQAAGLVASACGGVRLSVPVKQERDHAARLPSLEGLRHAG